MQPEIPGAPQRTRSAMTDLGPRIASALAMAAVALGLLYAGALPFTALILLVALVMSWEWGNVVRGAGTDAVLAVHGIVVTAAVILAGLGYAALALITLIAGTFVVGALRFGEKARLSAVGVLYVGFPAVALVVLRLGVEPYGFRAVLFVVLAVIATDTLAYFTGRGVGGPKLWPSVSPNKTWSGLIGGITGAALVGAAFAYTTGSASVVLSAAGAGRSGADQVVATTTVNGTALQASQGFQLTVTSATISGFTTDLALIGPYGQANLTVSVSGAYSSSMRCCA